MKLAVLSLLWVSILAGLAEAEEAAPPIRHRVECQMVTLPQKEFLALLPDLQQDERFDAAWAQVQKMIEQGSAKVESILAGSIEDGARAQFENIEEVRYPTEFEPPDLPSDVPKDKNLAEVLKAWPAVGITPTSFETRNTGTTLELEIKGQKTPGLAKVEVVAQHVRLLRFVKYDGGRLANGEHLSVDQPIFHSMKNQSSLTLREGRRLLLGVHRLPDGEKIPSFEIFVLRVTQEKITP